MDQESSHVVTFDLGLLLQDQMRAAKLKGAYNSLIAHTFFKCETNQKDIMAWDLLMWSNLALYPSVQVGNTCLALVHCLYGGYNLHRFSNALGLVLSGVGVGREVKR